MRRIGSVAGAVLTFTATLLATGGLAGMAGPAVAPAAAEEATARVVGPVRLYGLFFEVGEHIAQFMGALHGTVFVESGATALDGWAIVCPASFQIAGATPTFSAEGQCALAKEDAHKIYARWTCAGTMLQGCRGRFTVTGGTGRFAQVSGESDVIVRSTLVEIADVPPSAPRGPLGVAREIATGLFILPNLRYRVP